MGELQGLPCSAGKVEAERQPAQEGKAASQIGSGPSAFIAIEGSQALALFG